MTEKEWQPIETAPKDGTPFLGWCPQAPGSMKDEICALSFDPNADGRIPWCVAGVEERLTWSEPTHWMPLPPPPKEAP